MVGSDGIPLYWPNLYSTIEFRNRGKSHNSARNMLMAVSSARLWAESIGRDFDEDLSSGAFFNFSDAEAIANFLDYTAKFQDKIAARSHQKQSAGNVSRLESARPNVRKMAHNRGNTIQAADKATRIRYVASYAEWMLMRRSGLVDRQGSFDPDTKVRAVEAIARLRSLAPRVRQRLDDETLEAIDIETCKTIEQVIQPDAERNPFSHPFVQFRNYLIWRLFLDTGCRIDELHNIKANDVVYASRELNIRVSKTRPRTLPISKHTANAFDVFVDKYWAKLPKSARSREWLFTTETGTHLSKQTISTMFQTIREKVPEVPEWLTSHTMRRTWNERFSLMVDQRIEKGNRITPDQEKAMRNRLMGWSDGSEMGEIYNRRHTRRTADKVAKALLDEIGPDPLSDE